MHFSECLCVQVWDSNATDINLSNSGQRAFTVGWDDIGEEEAVTLAPTVIAEATTENIQKAKEFINGLTTFDGNVAVCFGGIAL